MKIKSALFFIFLIAAIRIGPITGEIAMQPVTTTSPIKEKTLVDPLAVKEYVEANFACRGSVTARILNVGVNDIYYVEVGSEKYVLRLSRADKNLTLTDSSFLFELAWLEFLNDRHVPVSFPIRRIDKQLFGIIEAPEGPRYATLFSFAEGTTDLDEEQAFILGRSLAQLHLISDDFKTDLGRDHLTIDQLVDEPLTQIKMTLDNSRVDELKILNRLADRLREQISSVASVKGTYGIIAGDIHGYNQHFTEDNRLTMFDFEFCAYGYRVYDIATFRWSRGSDNNALWTGFLSGYRSVRKLDDTEIEAIEAFVRARHLWWISTLLKMPECQELFNEKFWNSAFSGFETYLSN